MKQNIINYLRDCEKATWADYVERLETALAAASELLAEIMRDEVNHQYEAEKWLRAYAPQPLCPEKR